MVKDNRCRDSGELRDSNDCDATAGDEVGVERLCLRQEECACVRDECFGGASETMIQRATVAETSGVCRCVDGVSSGDWRLETGDWRLEKLVDVFQGCQQVGERRGKKQKLCSGSRDATLARPGRRMERNASSNNKRPFAII